VRGLVFAVLAEGALVLAAGCANVDRGLGDPCIRNEDCLSGVCAGQQCVASPALFDATPVDTGVDSTTDAPPADAAPDVAPPPADTGQPPHDSGQPVDSGKPHDAGDASHPHDGSAHDGSARDGSARDGSARDGSAHDGSARDGATHDSTTHDAGTNDAKDGGKSKDALADHTG
jgi:hypothetical protein